VAREPETRAETDLPTIARQQGPETQYAPARDSGQAAMFRAHDVRATRRVLDMVGAIRGTQPPALVRRGLA
jgi:dihydropteroate synthase